MSPKGSTTYLTQSEKCINQEKHWECYFKDMLQWEPISYPEIICSDLMLRQKKAQQHMHQVLKFYLSSFIYGVV